MMNTLGRNLRAPVGWLLFLAAFLLPFVAEAAKIGDVADTNVMEQVGRFFSFRDPSVRYAVFGSVILGLCCGLLGSFIVVRKLSLMGDALSHAVLPGVALGFLWNMSKDPIAIFIGATIAGLLGTFVVGLITQTTRLKEDTALGMVLASFFAVGISLVTMMQKLPTGNKSGIDKFLFGQASAIGAGDIRLMSIVAVVVLIILIVFYKEFLVSSFDAAFARVTGIRVRLFHHLLMLLLAFSVVIALQAVGVVLVSAMLITPAATAYLMTDRMHRMLIYSSLIGITCGVVGAFLSFLGNNLPTGPLMVLATSLVFAAAFFFSPRHGLATRWWMHRSRSQSVGRENTLKAVYHVLEREGFGREGVTLTELAQQRKQTLESVQAEVGALRRHGLATLPGSAETVYLTPQGLQVAKGIVRNHRLWELYLTNAADYAADHVHDDAEKIEHVLGEDLVRRLEKQLNYASTDPHGKRIPSSEEIHATTRGQDSGDLIGYGKGQS